LRAGVQPAIAAGEAGWRTAVELELISILQGAAFRASPRSCEFLRFVVEEALAGRADSLKERTIGAAVLGRNPGYDTGADAGVRVRANDVRKRLAAHYERVLPKAGYRIEIAAGSYAPAFVAQTDPAPQDVPKPSPVPPMRLWQLAAPTVFAVFLALIAIRVDADNSDSYTRFWSHVLAHRSAIVVELDRAGGAESISPAMAEAALPFSRIGASLQVPVHLRAASHHPFDPLVCLIRLSTDERPASAAREWEEGGVKVFYLAEGGPALWLVGKNPEAIGRAAQSLSTRTSFPEVQ
jgi:hypothetical protein